MGNVDKLYRVEKISFFDFSIKAYEIDLKVSDVPEQEIFDISDFNGYRVVLNNNKNKSILKEGESI